MAVFDAFEGDEYYKQSCSAELLFSSQGEQRHEEEKNVDTFLYCWSDSLRSQLLPEGWSYERFREEHLEKYIEMCRGFEEELRGAVEEGGGEGERGGDGAATAASAAARSSRE